MITLLVGATRAAYIGPGLNLEPHTNAVDTVALCLDAPMKIRMLNKAGTWGNWQLLEAAIIPAGTLHHLVAEQQSTMVFLYLDPHQDTINSLNVDMALRCRTALANQRDCDVRLGDIERNLGIERSQPASNRISRVIAQLNQHPAQFESIEDAAKLANLSSSRFRALFAKQTGLTFRRYRLWRRMAFIIKEVSQGSNLTQACLDAGFSDSSHLSTTFKAMFGISPGFLLDPRVNIRMETPHQECGGEK